ncbi:peptidoglycan bridge formation glycyltransferase FemA/FemB family protein [candidate division KSB1 bacterium]|nr:peptidoglycan bridge formation glycyltransferase FemA/FemB family protein [candidate division KSB1 bacterium]RQV99814.1 MAG: peptidoglycan bridge formation glycyltransferase FemA/FemB family protein [candidate division KSB1 bacterium]
MSIEIKRYSHDLEHEWEEFVCSSNNGTLFHTRKFLSYHPPDRFADFSLLFTKNGRVLALLPAVDFSQDGIRVLLSHRGASYGGFVIKDTLSIREAFDLVEALCTFAKAEGFDAVDLTPPPQIYLRRPSNYIDFALVQNGFQYRKREISSVIPLDFTSADILNTFNEGSRRAVRRGKKLGVIVRETENMQEYERFYAILKKNLRLRHGVNPTHTLPELLRLKQLFPGHIKLFAASTPEREMVAGVVMFVCNPRVVLAFYISHDEELQHYRGVNCLFHDIVDWGICEGYKFLDFGIFTVNEDPNWGLARFKESFGAQGVFRDSLRLTF